MTTLNLEDELVSLLRQQNQPIETTVREMLVLELYRRGTVSSGKAAEMLGMSRVALIQYASRLGIPYLDMSEDEWEAEQAASERV